MARNVKNIKNTAFFENKTQYLPFFMTVFCALVKNCLIRYLGEIFWGQTARGGEITHFGRRRRPMKPHILAPKAPKFWKNSVFDPLGTYSYFGGGIQLDVEFFSQLFVRKGSNWVNMFGLQQNIFRWIRYRKNVALWF